jgi:hypothetical protein
MSNQFTPYREPVIRTKKKYEFHEEFAAIKLPAAEEGKRKGIVFNTKALGLLKFNREVNDGGSTHIVNQRLGLEVMDFSHEKEEKIQGEERTPWLNYLVFSTDQKKSYKFATSQVQGGSCYSSAIFDALCELYNLNPNTDSYLQIVEESYSHTDENNNVTNFFRLVPINEGVQIVEDIKQESREVEASLVSEQDVQA